MKNFFRNIALSLVLVLLTGATARAEVQKFILDNGMTVLINEIPGSPVVAFQAVIKSGSATEGKYLGCGISHFIEHLLFKGTKKHAVGEISRQAKALGGIINASTSFDYTSVTLELPGGTFEQGLDIVSDMLMNSVFDPEQVEKEREVIFGEMRLYKDNPDRYLGDTVFKNAYTTHPYRHPIIGYESLFRNVTRDDLYEYFKSIYIPNNIVFVVSGNIRTNDAFEKIQTVFKDFAPEPYLARTLPSEPKQLLAREHIEEYPTKLARMSLNYQGISIAHSDMFAMDLLAMMLGQGESSRLYANIFKKKNLVYAISAENFTPMDQGVFEISCHFDAPKKDAILKAIKEEITAVKTKGVSLQELEKVKTQILSNYYFDHQKAADIGYDAVMDEALIGDYQFHKKYVEAIRSITPDDIKRVANAYLVDSTSTLVILIPKKEGESTISVDQPVRPGEIKKIILDNGLTILLREDKSFPLVAVRLALQGGLRQEPEGKDGLANLAGDLWAKATVQRTAEQIAQSTEEHGMSFGSSSGLNSFGMSSDFLSKDLDFAVALLEDVVKNPAFPDSELLKIKEQVKSALMAREDDIYISTLLQMKKTLFEKHPFRKDTLGTMESVEKITRDDIVRFHKAWFAPNNMVLSVFGDFDSQKLLPILKNKFGTIQKRDISLKSFEESAPTSTKTMTHVMDKTQAMVIVGFQGAKLSSQDRYGLAVLTSVLGSPLSGRIFDKIRDEFGKSYRLGGNYSPGIDTGIIYFYVVTTQDQVDKVKDVLISQMEELQKEGIMDQELADTKMYLKGTWKMNLETNGALSSIVTYDELYGLGYETYKQYSERVDAVTKEDAARLAGQYLTMDKAAVVVTRRGQNKNEKKE